MNISTVKIISALFSLMLNSTATNPNPRMYKQCKDLLHYYCNDIDITKIPESIDDCARAAILKYHGLDTIPKYMKFYFGREIFDKIKYPADLQSPNVFCRVLAEYHPLQDNFFETDDYETECLCVRALVHFAYFRINKERIHNNNIALFYLGYISRNIYINTNNVQNVNPLSLCNKYKPAEASQEPIHSSDIGTSSNA